MPSFVNKCFIRYLKHCHNWLKGMRMRVFVMVVNRGVSREELIDVAI